ncbi:MAG TPA: RnfH family protein [Gammaproteobacteria bacterium]|nr:RnfH family protein [Gammaproteobacteria bacterium]
MASADRIQVEVAYARPDEQVILPVEVPEGTTLEQAVQQSGILERFPEIDFAQAKMGIFGKLNKRDYVLRPGDRVEIYRPLIADPKEIRKQRAAEGKRMKRGGGEIEGDKGSGDD